MFRTLVKPLNKPSNFLVCIPCRTAKAGVPITWTRPAKVPSYKPSKSGDLKPLKEINLKKVPRLYEKSSELQTADEIVKRLFTLEFQTNPVIIEEMRDEYKDLVRRHQLDADSPEAIIAGMTASIRHVQIYMDNHTHKKPPRHMRIFIKELVEKRAKRLRQLRVMDYRRYEWILEKLDLVHKSEPEPPERVERKKSLKRLTDKYCENLKQQKLYEFREKLESEQEEFLMKKLETYKWIQEKEKEFGMGLSVTDEEIESIGKLLDDLRLRKKEVEVE